jgi:hypothetical protein
MRKKSHWPKHSVYANIIQFFLIHADISKVLIRAYRKHLDSDEACREIASSPKTSGASDCVTTRLFGRKDLECDRFGIVTYPSFVVERCRRRERSK